MELLADVRRGMVVDMFAGTVRNEPERFLGLKFDDSGLLWFGKRLYVPTGVSRTLALEEQHKSRLAGHPGRRKTIALVSRVYWWQGWRKDTELFVDTCDCCQRYKHSRQRPSGLLEPLPIPDRPWG